MEEKHILHQSRTIALLFINEFSPFAIQNHSSPISMSMVSLKKISQKLLKLESGKEALADGRTDGHPKRFGEYNIIPRHFFVAGYKNVSVISGGDYKTQLFTIVYYVTNQPYLHKIIICYKISICKQWFCIPYSNGAVVELWPYIHKLTTEERTDGQTRCL